MENDFIFLMQFVLEQAENQPDKARARIYRGRGRICGDPEWQNKLESLADSVQRADELYLDLKFSFVQDDAAGNSGQGNGEEERWI